MNVSIQVKKDVTAQGQLDLQIQGKISMTEADCTKVRLLAVFSDGEQDRRIPIPTQWMWEENGGNFFSSYTVWLKHIFLHGSNAEEVKAYIEMEYGRERRTFLEETFVLSGELFRKSLKKHGLLYSVHKGVLACGAILWLPVMLVDGYMAVKGYKELELDGKRASGKKAMIFHANNKIRKFTGFSFSVREHKTNYFAKCYEKYRKKPCKEKQILFLSERRVEKNGNLDLIYRELKKQEGLEIVEFFNEKTIDRLSRKEIRKAAKLAAASKMIILEDFYPQLHALDIREETKVVQLWHACGAFKTFGFSRLDKIGGPLQDSRNHRSYDYVFVSSKEMEPIYSEAFAIPSSHVKALGVPRTDIFFDQMYQLNVKKKLYEKYPQMKEKKVVLFAPTFRGDGNKDAYYPVERFSVDSFLENVPKDYRLIIKQHPFVKQTFSYAEQYRDRVLDLSGEEQINDLLCLTDVLVTDYSSSVFEAALLSIPMVFYVFDKEEYMQERDIYSDFDSFAPGELVETEEALVDAVVSAIERGRDGSEKEKNFREYYLDALDGRSTERIVDFLMSKYNR